MMTALHYQGLVEVGDLIASRQVSAVEVTRHQLERCEKLDSLNTFITLLADRALAEAETADRDIAAGLRRSVLHGVPIALKDLYDFASTPTTAGMPSRLDAIAAANATVTQKLIDAGAVILGKTCLTEGAYAEHRAPFGTPVNPWNADRWCGASSSGSAVGVAAGLFFAGLATETGGSIRIPSAMNGVTGFKPSWGRVSRAGIYQLAASLDHAGPIARSATDAAAVLGIIAGRDSADPTSSCRPVENYLAEAGTSLKGMRIGIDMTFSHAGTDPEHVSAMLAAADTLRDLGVELIDITLPNSEQIIWDWFDVCAVQNALVNGPLIDKQPGVLGPALTELVARGRALNSTDYQVVINRANAFRGDFEALFASLDLVLSPAMAFSPPRHEAMKELSDDMISGIHRFTCPFTMSGHPVLSMPGGVHSDGMPINIQLIGPLFGEAVLARAGMAFQKATQWHRRRPLS